MGGISSKALFRCTGISPDVEHEPVQPMVSTEVLTVSESELDSTGESTAPQVGSTLLL